MERAIKRTVTQRSDENRRNRRYPFACGGLVSMISSTKRLENNQRKEEEEEEEREKYLIEE
jgi:hypothetical protein